MTRVDAAWVEADEDGLPRSETFSVSERRLGPNGTAVMSWCPRMDLLAIGTAAGRVCLYRHIWQRVWTVPPVEDGVAVTHLHWREDGKVLLVAYGNQTARLYDVEKPTLLHTLSLDGNVTCCDWRTHQINVRDENGSRNSSGRTQQDEPPLRMLKPDRAPLTLRRFAPKFEVPSTVEGEEFVDDTDPAAATDSTFNLLAVGTDAGVVLLFGCGFVLLGHFNCSETDRGNIRGLSLSFESASLAITHDGADNNIVTQQVSLEGVCSNVEEMLSFCVVQRSCSATIKYLECTLECMKATWHSFLLDLDDRFSAFLRDTAPGVKLHDELLVLLVTGTPAATPVITDRSNDAHSITVQWGRIAMHDFNGPPRHYVVSYKGLAVDYVENGGQSATSPELDATDVIVPYDASEENPSVTLMDLEPNRMYEIKVAPENTEFAPGPFSATESVQTWSFRPAELPTVQFHDDRPNGESKQTTLRITWPIINTRFGPVRQVQVIVEPEDSRHFNTMYNCTSASGEDECAFGDWQTNENARVNKQTPRAYIAFQRQYTGDDATQTSGSLVVGDELNYGGFFNGPLRAGTTYTVRLRAFTQSGDGTEMFDTVGPIKEPVYDEKGRLISSPQASTSSPAASPIGAIVGAIIVVLIIVVLVFLFVRYRRNQKSKPPLFESSAPSNGTTNVHSSQGNPYFGNGGSNGYGQAVSSLQTSASSMPMSPMGYAQNGQHHQQQQGGLAARGNMPVQQPPGASMASTSFGGPPVPVRPPGTMAAPVVAGDSSSIYSSMGGAGAPQMPPVQRHEVSVPDLPRVIEQMSANSNFIFSEEYECVEKGDQFPRTSSQLDANRSKNRYANILAYDYTRVKLSVIGGDPNSDYINANYIDGYSVPKYYIAAQGPLPHTVIDFWRMIWENRTTVIVMVTRLEEKGRIKCHQYWPQAVGDQLPLTTNMSIWFTKQEEFPDFVIRTLTVQVGRQSRTVTQFQYVSWPDHGVPDSTAGIITMLRKAKVLRSQPNAGPMVVHCSAGVGRTGTFLALDYNLDKASRESRVDIFGCLNMMRRQRNTMVQTEDQYIFIYSSLCDALSTAVTEMSPKSLRKHFHELRRPVAGSNMSNLEQEFNRLAQGPAPAVRTDSAQILANKEKNRFNNILPFDNTRVKLQTVPGVVGSDYINASFIDGFKQKGAFIATQGPLENTLADFWRMVWEQGVHSVVMMTHLEENGRVKSEQYWPDPDEPPLNFGDYQVTLLSEVNRGFFMERTMMLVNLLLDETREVKQWQYLEWPTQGTPTAGTNLVRMIQEIEQYANSRVVMPQEESIYGNREIINEHAILQQMKPLVVHCSAGVGRTGVFVAAMICLKRMREENKMDLYQVTKHMRTQRMAMIQTPDQYAFVYRVVLDWLDMSAPVQAQPESMYSSMPAGGKAPRLSLQQEVDSQLPMRNESDSDTTRVHHGHAQPPTGAPPVRRPPPSIPPKSTSIKLKAGSNEEGGYGFDA